ncbi:MAG: two-component sensor histidine kinase [Pseudomonadota bacterium]|nr:two-component sensor histidine kinase [Pseudomonadota bacterium]
MLNSLRARILIFTTLLTALLMLGVGVWLYQSFFYAQLDGLQERLKLHSYSILSLADFHQDQVWVPGYLPEARLNQSGSGLYARILGPQQTLVWQSGSAQHEPLLPLEQPAAGEWLFSMATRGDEEYLLARYGVSWDVAPGPEPVYTLLVAENLAPLRLQLREYGNSLALALLVFTALLLLMQLLILRWGLAPLRRVSADLKKLQQGQQADLSGQYPQELQPLTSNLNQLLQSEQQQRERYRYRLADLSHSLKTPLAVLTGLLGKDAPSAAELREMRHQAGLMDERIRFQLQRAVSQASALSIHRTDVVPVLESLIRAMRKVYAASAPDIQLQAEAVCFSGDDQDLMEIAGNLLDNACKYGHGIVRVSCGPAPSGWFLQVEDNGPGIAAEARGQVIRRGVRLDTVAPGQGLGLALVAELLSVHHARLSICQSELGGACLRIEFEDAAAQQKRKRES